MDIACLPTPPLLARVSVLSFQHGSATVPGSRIGTCEPNVKGTLNPHLTEQKAKEYRVMSLVLAVRSDNDSASLHRLLDWHAYLSFLLAKPT